MPVRINTDKKKATNTRTISKVDNGEAMFEVFNMLILRPFYLLFNYIKN